MSTVRLHNLGQFSRACSHHAQVQVDHFCKFGRLTLSTPNFDAHVLRRGFPASRNMAKPAWTPEETQYLDAAKEEYTNGSTQERQATVQRVCKSLAALRKRDLTELEMKVTHGPQPWHIY